MGPLLGPMTAKTGQNAVMGPDFGPMTAPRIIEKVFLAFVQKICRLFV